MDFNIIWAALLAFSVPSAIFALLLRRLEKKMDAERAARRKYELFQAKTQAATIALCKANAIALKNGKCNGETSAALQYLNSVKYEQREFLTEYGINHLF
jgi:hypothetical protein